MWIPKSFKCVCESAGVSSCSDSWNSTVNWCTWFIANLLAWSSALLALGWWEQDWLSILDTAFCPLRRHHESGWWRLGLFRVGDHCASAFGIAHQSALRPVGVERGSWRFTRYRLWLWRGKIRLKWSDVAFTFCCFVCYPNCDVFFFFFFFFEAYGSMNWSLTFSRLFFTFRRRFFCTIVNTRNAASTSDKVRKIRLFLSRQCFPGKR